MSKRELTYEPEPGEQLRQAIADGQLKCVVDDQVRFVSDVDWTPRPEDVDHDVMTCHHPVCRETRRIILARARGLRKE